MRKTISSNYIDEEEKEIIESLKDIESAIITPILIFNLRQVINKIIKICSISCPIHR
ncbi:MAG: hypothetical protein ACYCS0_06835 [bacterium]